MKYKKILKNMDNVKPQWRFLTESKGDLPLLSPKPIAFQLIEASDKPQTFLKTKQRKHYKALKDYEKVKLRMPVCFSESSCISLHLHFHLHTLHSNNSKPAISSARSIWEFSEVGPVLI